MKEYDERVNSAVKVWQFEEVLKNNKEEESSFELCVFMCLVVVEELF